MIREALFRHLTADTAVGAFVTGVLPRVFWQVVPQKKRDGPELYPAVVYEISAIERAVGYCGTFGRVKATVSIDCYSPDQGEAQDLAEAVRASLLDFRGALGGMVDVSQASVETEFDLQDIDPGLYRVAQSWSIWYLEE